MTAQREYEFEFADEARAGIFVERLMLKLRDVVVFRFGTKVKVLDGKGQASEILRLSKISEATSIKATGREPQSF